MGGPHNAMFVVWGSGTFTQKDQPLCLTVFHID